MSGKVKNNFWVKLLLARVLIDHAVAVYLLGLVMTLPDVVVRSASALASTTISDYV